jgi:sterol desaturase/sphingolipid hydroxylase (fatty acid hydroxylase superfamily)
MSLFWMLTGVLICAGALMTGLAIVYRMPRFAPRRIYDDLDRKLKPEDVKWRLLGNALFSGVLSYALAFGPYRWLFHERPTSLFTIVWQAVAILLLYDVGYYFMHRLAFHQWAWMKRVHTVHHLVRHPSALDSLFLHPLETFCGLALLSLCTWVVGPVHVVTYVIVFAAYSFLNILVHSGLDLPFFPFRIASYLARKHDTHHTSMRGGNFASITPLCDLIFGTAE